jgi:hypothetical protein
MVDTGCKWDLTTRTPPLLITWRAGSQVPVEALNVKHDGGRASRSAAQVDQPALHFLIGFLIGFLMHQASI